jgi:hypothetical protein
LYRQTGYMQSEKNITGIEKKEGSAGLALPSVFFIE